MSCGAKRLFIDNECSTLKESASSFPLEFASFRILPSLVTALEYGGASAATIVPLVLQFGKNVPQDEYMNIILGPLVRLFASPDRGTRMALLDNLAEYADKLDKKIVVDKVWPNLVREPSLLCFPCRANQDGPAIWLYRYGSRHSRSDSTCDCPSFTKGAFCNGTPAHASDNFCACS